MATANEKLVVAIEGDLKIQQALSDFVTQAQAAFKQVSAAAGQMNSALSNSVAPLRNIKVNVQQATNSLKQMATQGQQSGNTLRSVFQNAVLGFQVFSVGLKNIGSQGFVQLARGAQDLSRNIFRSFRGISTEGQSIFGKLISFIGSSLEGVVTLTGNVASNVIKGFAAIPRAIGGIFGGLAQTVGGALLFFPNAVTKLIGLFTAGFGSIAKVITDSIGGALSAVGQIAENISRIVSGVLRGITTVAREVADRVVAVFQGIVSTIADAFGIIADIALKAFGAIGIAGAGAAALILRDFSTFDIGLRRVFGAVGATTQVAREGLTDFANDVRTAFGRGAEEVTGGLFLAVTSGADSTEEALANFREAVRLTEAFGGDLNSTLLAITRTLEVYRGEVSGAAEVSDLLAGVIQVGQGSLNEFAGSIGNVTATAAAAGIPLRELLATLATLTQRLPVDQAVTSLNRLIETLVSAQPEAEEFRRKAGLAFSELSPAIAAQIDEFKSARDALAAQVTQMESAGKSTKSLRDAMKELDSTLESITKRNRQFGSLTDSIKQFFEALKSGAVTPAEIRQLFPEAKERRGILQLGSEQGIISGEQARKFFEDTTGLVERQLLEVQDSIDSNFRRMVQSALVAGNEIAAAFGPVVVGALEEFRILLEARAGDLRTFFQSANFTEFRDKLTESVRGFIREIPAAVTAVRSFIGGAIERFESFREAATPIFESVAEKASDLIDIFSRGPSFEETFRGILAGDFEPLKAKFSTIFEGLRLDPLVQGLERAGKALVDVAFEGLKGLYESLRPSFEPILAEIKSTFESIRSIVAGIKLPELSVRGVTSAVVGAAPNIALGAVDLLGNAILGAAEGAGNIIIGALQGGANIFNSIVERFLRDLGGDEPADRFRAAFRADQAPSESQIDRDQFRAVAQANEALSALSDTIEALGGFATPTAFAMEGLAGVFPTLDAAIQAQAAAQIEAAVAQTEAALRADLARQGWVAVANALTLLRDKFKEAEAAQAALLSQTQAYVQGLIAAAGGLEGIAKTIGARLGRLLTTGSASLVQGPAGKPPEPGLTPEEIERLRLAFESAQREARENADKIASRVEAAREAFIDGFQEQTEIVRSRLDRLIEVSQADIGQLATLGRKNTSVSLDSLREASEQKKIAQGTLKAVGVLASAFADLGPRESAVFDPNILANILGVGLKDLNRVLLEATRILFGEEPRSGSAGQAAARQAQDFIGSKDARTALKLLSKDGAEAAAAFRGFAESRGGVGEFTSKLISAAESLAFTKGEFGLLNLVSGELQEKFGDLSTTLEAFGLGGGAAQAAENTAIAARALAESAQKNDVILRDQKGFSREVEKLAKSGDIKAVEAAIRKVEEQGTRTDLATGETEGLSKRDQFQLDVLSKLRDQITGKPEGGQKIESLGGIESPVKVITEKEGIAVSIVADSIAALGKELAAPLKAIVESIGLLQSQLLSSLLTFAQTLDQSIQDAAGAIVNAINQAFGIGLRAPGFATGGIVTKETLARIGEAGPEAVIPLGRLPQILAQFAAPALKIDQASLRAELPARPTASVGSSLALGAVGTRLDSSSREASGSAREMAALASMIDKALGKFAESQGIASREMSALERRVANRIGSVEKVINQEVSKNKRYNAAFIGLRGQGTPAV